MARKLGGWYRCSVRVLLLSVMLGCAAVQGQNQVLRTAGNSHTVYHVIDIPSLNAAEALTLLAEQTEALFLFPYDIAESRSANAVRGKYTIFEALDAILHGSGLATGLSKTGVIEIYVADNAVRVNENNGEQKPVNTKKSLIAVLLSALMGGGAQQAAAESAGGDDGGGDSGVLIEEIIVTAQKREQRAFDVPISLVALSQDVLDARRIDNFEELGFAVPGLSVQDNGGFNRRVFIRGLGNSAGFTSSLIGLYIDEVSVSGNPAFTLDLRPYDLERVEVLRGPQGTLFGDGSVGGTIRFITKKPELDKFSLKADMSASFTEDGESGHKIQGVVNVPLIDDELALRVGGTFENTGGWIDQPAASVKDYNDQELTNIRVNGLWRPTDALALSAMAIVHRNDASLNIGEDEDGNFTQAFGLTTRPSTQDDYELYNLTLTYDFGSFRLLSSTGYLDSSKETNQSGARILGFHTLIEFPVNTKVFTEEFRLSSTGEGAWNWTLGAFYKDRTIGQTGASYFGLPGAPGVLPVPFLFTDRQESKSWAVFGDTSYALTERLELGAGLRYFEDDRNFSNGLTQQESTFDSLSPRAFVNVDLTDDVKAYASVAKGFRSGGFNQFGQPAFDPETVWTYELGTKLLLLDGRLSAELAVFYSDYTDFQIQGILPGSGTALAITSNGGDAEIKGVDWAFTWKAMDDLTLGFNGNYVDAQVVDLKTTASSHNVGDRLDYVPKYSATLSATQDFAWKGRPGFVRVDYNHQGRMLFTNRRFGIPGSPSDVLNMLNINVKWQWSENVSLGVFGKNLLNDRGLLDGLAPLNEASRTRPRTVGLQLGLDF